MGTTLKLNKKGADLDPPLLKKSPRQVIFSVIWGQKKWFAWIFIIFGTFICLDCFGLPPTKDAGDKPALFPGTKKTSQVVTGSDLQASQAGDEKGILGGSYTLGSLVAPTAQAGIDFSADDDLENSDLLLVQENCLVSCTNPSGTLSFSEFSREIVTYVVKQGDIPGFIAASFNINTDTLLWANNLQDGDIIKPGQELIILPINGVRVKVNAKDTVESLAKNYNGGAMEIIAFNNLPLDGALKAGEYIIIPGGEMPASARKSAVPSKKYAQSTTQASSWLIVPTSGYNWGRLHGSNAVDIANDCGTPVYAAAAGTVTLSDGVGYNGGYGKYIKILHPNGVATLYAHGSRLLVSEGEWVVQGQLIMLIGTTGRSTGCHLHFEVRGATNPLVGRRGYY